MAKVLAIWSSDFFDVTWKRRGAIHSTKIPTGPTGKSGGPKRWTRFFETFSVGPNRSIEFWTKISDNFGWIERRSVTSRYHGSTISGWQQNQRRRRRQGERQKNKIFILTNNNFARESRYFVHFFAIVAPLRHWKLPNFTSPLYGVGEQNTKVVAFLF